MEQVLIDGVLYWIEYADTQIGNTIYDKNNKSVYTADISDADELNWIVLDYKS